jgi:hypothetical protein
MKQPITVRNIATLVLIAFLLIAWPTLVQTQDGELSLAGSDYGLTWWTVDGGGGAASDNGAQYALTGTIGQADAGASSNSQYRLVSGFWGTGSPTEHSVYLPLVLHDAP